MYLSVCVRATSSYHLSARNCVFSHILSRDETVISPQQPTDHSTVITGVPSTEAVSLRRKPGGNCRITVWEWKPLPLSGTVSTDSCGELILYRSQRSHWCTGGVCLCVGAGCTVDGQIKHNHVIDWSEVVQRAPQEIREVWAVLCFSEVDEVLRAVREKDESLPSSASSLVAGAAPGPIPRPEQARYS